MSSIKNAIIILLFATIVAGAYYMFTDGKLPKIGDDGETTPNTTGFMKTEEEFRTKLAELRIEQEKMQRRKELMIERKDDIVKELKDKGISASSDISDKTIKYKVTSLKKSLNSIKDVDRSIEKYQQGIDAVEVMLAKLEQDRISDEVAISEEKAEELNIMLLDLDEKLSDGDDIFEEEELRNVLGLELGE